MEMEGFGGVGLRFFAPPREEGVVSDEVGVPILEDPSARCSGVDGALSVKLFELVIREISECFGCGFDLCLEIGKELSGFLAFGDSSGDPLIVEFGNGIEKWDKGGDGLESG